MSRKATVALRPQDALRHRGCGSSRSTRIAVRHPPHPLANPFRLPGGCTYGSSSAGAGRPHKAADGGPEGDLRGRGCSCGYRSQRESPRDRSFSRAFSLREKIGGKGAIGSYIAKPKGMHGRTFERAMQRVHRAEQIVAAHAALSLARLTKRLPSLP